MLFLTQQCDSETNDAVPLTERCQRTLAETAVISVRAAGGDIAASIAPMPARLRVSKLTVQEVVCEASFVVTSPFDQLTSCLYKCKQFIKLLLFFNLF